MRWIALFIGLPAVELALLIEIGGRIGTPATLGLIVVTGIIGASLARHQGLRVAAEIQREIAQGQLPADSLVDGLLILIAAALLVTPGILTDAVGFLCLTPGFRQWIKREIVRRLERAVREQRLHVRFETGSTASFFAASERDEIDVTPPGPRRPDEPTIH